VKLNISGHDYKQPVIKETVSVNMFANSSAVTADINSTS